MDLQYRMYMTYDIVGSYLIVYYIVCIIHDILCRMSTYNMTLSYNITVLRHNIVVLRVLGTAPISILIKLKMTGNSMSGGEKGKIQWRDLFADYQ